LSEGVCVKVRTVESANVELSSAGGLVGV
jgi:hypothetical protein